MSKIGTVKAPEQWIVEVNGGYDALFDIYPLPVALQDDPDALGTVHTVGGKIVGIIASVHGKEARIMARGNPTLVNLVLTTEQDEALKALGIVNVGPVV